jgi:uncharacterized membrane protein YcjF (UPF0283 family)
MLPEQQREQFKNDVAQMKLKTGTSRYDGIFRVVGALLMIGGVAAAFIIYEASAAESDARNIASQQILAVGFLGVTLIGVALFVVASLGRLLRLWLLRQLYEGQAHVDQLADAVGRGSSEAASSVSSASEPLGESPDSQAAPVND